MKLSSCAITSFRLKDEHLDSTALMTSAFSSTISSLNALAKLGVTDFMTTLEPGIATWCVDALTVMKPMYPKIKIHAVLPSFTQTNGWSSILRKEYYKAMQKCDSASFSDVYHTPTSTLKRNTWLAKNCDCVLMARDGSVNTSLQFLINRALLLEKPIFSYDIDIISDSLEFCSWNNTHDVL